MKTSFRPASLLALPLLLLAGLPAFAINGTVRHQSYAGGPWNTVPLYTYVKLCNVASSGAWSGSGSCYTTFTDSGGNFAINVPAGSYATFAWNSSYAIGSHISSAWGAVQDFTGNWTQGNQLNVSGYTGWVNLYVVASPNQPQAVYPSNGAQHVPLNFTLRWTPDRTGWTVVYDIYAHGSGASESLVLSNIPCNRDASGNCSYPITNLVPAHLYYWRVVAKLYPRWPTDPPSSIYYTTSSAQLSFVTHGTTYSLTTVNGSNKVSADSCGGGSVSAQATGVGPCETLKLIDLNGGDLNSGDSVFLQVYGTPWYFSAQNGGGGALLANAQWGGPYEAFTISKTNGWGTIQNGDSVSLTASNGNYCSAELGGGDFVNCNRAALGAWETFTLGIMP